MYRILIVEDEPPITRYIKRLLETHCEGFEVIGTADNGLEALEKIQVLKPDLVLTDIKMPVMDGISLVKIIKTDHSEILTIVISGYQDFIYVKEALKEGVADYLLKPVDPKHLKNQLKSLVPKLEEVYNSNAVRQLKCLMQNLPVDIQKVNRYLNYRYFSALVIRRGALPRRFRAKFSYFEENLYRELQSDAAGLAKNINADRFWLIEGRDESELILIIGKDHVTSVNIRQAAEALKSIWAAHPNFHTIIYSSVFFELKSLEKNMNQLYDQLDQLTVIGKTQVLSEAASVGSSPQDLPVLGGALENKLEFLVSSRSMNNLKNEIVKLFEKWEKDSRTQIWIDKMIRKIFGIVEKYTSNLSPDLSLNIEKQLEEALFYSTSFGGLMKCVWDMIEDMICMSDSGCQCDKYDSINLLEKISKHIEINLSEPMTLQGICEVFGISQPYLSKIFRKYKKMSFVEYITDTRIGEAKRLMLEHPDMHLKDIASIVGYNDPNYFSRIFKTVTGFAPSGFTT